MAVARNRGANARNISQKIWLSSTEAEQVKVAAGEIPVAAWLRNLALGQPMPPSPTPRRRSATPAYAQAIQPLAVAVARVGNNLNQIARVTNTMLRANKPVDALQIATQLIRLRQELAAELRAVSGRLLPEVKDAGKDL
jgi:hypothetical protein